MNAESEHKERGMGNAKALAREQAQRGDAVHSCPYTDKRWRSCWLSEFSRAKQVDWVGKEKD